MPGPIPSEPGSAADPNNPNPAGDGNNGNTPTPGQDPNAKPDNKAGDATQVDFSKLGDDAFGKVFDDPRLFNHPRFKQLNDRAKQGAEAIEKLSKLEEEELKKQGKLQELVDKKGEEAAGYKAKWENEVANNQILSKASQLGAVDVELVLAAIDRTLIKVTNDGVTGVEEALIKLKDSKPILFGTASGGMPGTNPGGEPNVKKFKYSEIQDPAFWKENEAEIMKAMATPGGIEMDVPYSGVMPMTQPR